MINELIQFYLEGNSLTACAKHFKLDPNKVSRLLKEAGIKLRQGTEAYKTATRQKPSHLARTYPR